MAIDHIFIIGSGLMGGGIAQVALQNGFQVSRKNWTAAWPA